MDYSIYRLNLDVKTNRSQALLKVFKGDTAVRLVCMLTDGGRVFQLEDGNVSTITLTIPGSDPIETITHACYIRDNSIVYTFTKETTEFFGAGSGMIEAQLNVYGGVVNDTEENPIYPQTIATPKFSIEVSATANKPTNPIFEGINESVGIVLGAAAAENQREYNETVRQDTYTNAITTANDAKEIAENTQTITLGALGSIRLGYNSANGVLTLTYIVDGETQTKTVDLPLESSIMSIDEIKRDGKYYLKLTLQNDNTSEIELNDIFEGFVKTQAKANMIYGTDADKEDTVYPIDDEGAANKGSIVRRTYDNGGIYVPLTPYSSNEAASKAYVDKFVPITPRRFDDMPGVYAKYPNGSIRLVLLDFSFDPWADYGEMSPEQLENLEQYAGAIVQRGGGGEVYVPKKTFYEYEAASKWYVDELGKRVEQFENKNIVYDNKSGIMSKIPMPLVASSNAVVALIGGLNKKCKNMLPNGYGYYNYSAEWEYVGGVDLEEGVTYILDTDDTDLTIDLWYPYDSGIGSEYVEPGIFTVPVSGTYNFWVRTNASSSDVGRFRIVKYTGNIPVSRLTKADIKEYLNLKDAKVYELATVDAGENVLSRYYVPSVAFSDTKFSLGDGIKDGVDGCNYLDLTKNQMVGNYARIVFTGDENWIDKTISGTSATRYRAGLQSYALPSVSYKDNGNVDFNVPVPAICDSYDVGSITALGKGGYGFAISSTDIYFYDNNFPTVEAWKNYVKRRYASGNPITVVYKVASPNIEKANLPALAYLIYVKDGAYIEVLDKDGNLIAAPVSITFTKSRGD